MTVLLPDLQPRFEGTDRKAFAVDVPFTKAATTQEGDLILTGYANTWGVDRDGEFIAPTAFDDSLPAYLDKNPIVLWQHQWDKPIGTITAAELDATGLRVKATIPKPADGEPDWLHLAYNRMARGVVRTFSIGGFMDRVWEETLAMPMVVRVDLFEVSVVSIPANEDSLFAAAVKAARGEDPKQPRLKGAVIDQMEAILGMVDVTDPELLDIVSDETAKSARYHELARIYADAGYIAPALDAWSDAQKMPADGDEAILEKLDAIEGCIVKARGTVPASSEKTGRVLSKANESRLVEAIAAMDAASAQVREVLGQLPPEGDPGGPTPAEGEEGSGLLAEARAVLERRNGSQGPTTEPPLAEFGADPLEGQTTPLPDLGEAA